MNSKYLLGPELGKGSFGAIYVGRNLKNSSELVAIKLEPLSSNNPVLQKEARIYENLKNTGTQVSCVTFHSWCFKLGMGRCSR